MAEMLELTSVEAGERVIAGVTIPWVCMEFGESRRVEIRQDCLRLVELKTGASLKVHPPGIWGKELPRRGVYCRLSHDDAETLRTILDGIRVTERRATVPKWTKGKFGIIIAGKGGSVPEERTVYGWVRDGWGIALYNYTEDGAIDYDAPVQSPALTHLKSGKKGADARSVNVLKRAAEIFDRLCPRLAEIDDPSNLDGEEKDACKAALVEVREL